MAVSPQDAGADLLSFLSGRFIRESKTRLRRLLAAGCVNVNGRAARGTRVLAPGDVVEVPEETLAGPPPPASVEIEVLHEDARLLVVNKPAGLPVLPARGGAGREFYDSLAARLNAEVPEAGPYVRPHVVHRLDRETSGVLLVAKDKEAGAELAGQFQYRTVTKRYLAIVEGVLPRAELTVEVPMRRSPSSQLKMAADERSGKPARTGVRLREAFGHFSLLDVQLFTGRQHQIRFHMAAIGYPLAVDMLYGRRDVLTGAAFNRIVGKGRAPAEAVLLARTPLHALSIGYRPPGAGEPVECCAPVPADMEAFLDALRRLDPALPRVNQSY
ncbi:MAG: RluA family pseudouridine synthase [Phycisphaerae bacterium]|nr:RluA family pseudouridine synthase [Phycisphaerae bacterium]